RSQWVGPFEFHTLCTPVQEDYYETFDEDIDDAQPTNPETRRYCWDIADANEDDQTWQFSDTYAYINVGESNNDDWLISPAIELMGDYHKLEFNHKAIGGGDYDIDVMISDTDSNLESFTELKAYTDNAPDTEYNDELEYFQASGTIYLAFRVSPDMDFSAGQTIQIDDFSVKLADACPSPYDLERDPQTNTFTWTPGNDETQWEVALVEGDVTFPTDGIIVDAPSYTYEDELEEGEQYKFFVRAVCDENNTSNWAGPLKFITDCGQVFDTPFLETFEDDSESLNCWMPNAWFLQAALTPYEGDYAAEVYTWGSDDD